jgi:hypothetical protein
MKHKARSDAGLVVVGHCDCRLLVCGEHRVEQLRNGALLGEWQRFDLFELLPNLLLWSALLRRGRRCGRLLRKQRGQSKYPFEFGETAACLFNPNI